MLHPMTVQGALTGVGRFFEHAAAVVIGLIMMIVGLGLGVTMIMLPVGITIGLLGVAMLVAGVFARIDEPRS
jgi:membrane-bound ClpP family serine protease